MAAMQASIAELSKIDGISSTTAKAIHAGTDKTTATEIASRVIELGWQTWLLESESYPFRLKQIADPPPFIFGEGETISFADPMIAIVGTRHPTDRGRIFASTLASELVTRGIPVVSGMAEGIDSAAHMGAIEAKGKTIAVLGCSLDYVASSLRRQLAKTISENGLLLSEYLPGTRPDKSTFPGRNRIISGLVEGIVVVEAGKKSGALITATHALEQNKTLFAVPGAPDASMSQGANELIKQGARLITSVTDIFEELPQLGKTIFGAKIAAKLPSMTKAERAIFDSVAEGPKQIDQLSRSLQLPIADLMEFLLALELKGVVRELSGKRFTISEDYR